MQSVGTRLKKLRKSAKLVQKEAAAGMGVIRDTLASWETDRRKPPYSSLVLLADFYHTSTDYLLGRPGAAVLLSNPKNGLTEEWYALIRDAKAAGLEPADLQAFIESAKHFKAQSASSQTKAPPDRGSEKKGARAL